MKTFCFPLLLSLITITTMAQFSPALGPPQAGTAAIPLRTIDFAFITNLVKLGLDRAVVNINKKIDSNASSSGVNANLSYRIKSVHPAYKQTEWTTYPNSMFVQLRIWVEYTIGDIRYHNVPYFSRKLFQWINVEAWCDKWQTNEGKNRLTYTAEKPYLDEASFGEQALNFFVGSTLISYVDSKLSNSLSNGMASGELPIASQPCNCLNFKRGTAPTHADGYVGFYYFPVRKIAIEALYSDPVLRLLSIKRIATVGEILLDTQDLQIEYMANFDKGIMQPKPIAENETVAFKKEYSVKFEHPNPYNQLVVTVNVTVLNQQMRIYSGFLHFEKEQKFGEGVQKLTIMREVWRPTSTGPDGRPIKPYTSLMPAYELEFDIKYTKPKRY